jgi:Right handed beta helix region
MMFNQRSNWLEKKRLYALMGLLLVLLAACSQDTPKTTLNQDIDELGIVTRTYYVATNGNNSNDGSSVRPWRTISYAVSAASPVQASQQIIVRPGLYQEEVELGKSGTPGNYIRLVAQSGVTLRYQGGGGGFAQGILESSGKSYWLIRGFRIEGLAASTPETTATPIWGGIVLKDATGMIVDKNSVYRTGSSGIIVLPASYYGGGELEVTSKNIRVTNNTIDNANNWLDQEALSIWGVNSFDVSYNLVKNSKTEGIDVKVGSRNGKIHHNTVTNVAVWSGRGRNGGPAIYLDANRANLYNIDVYNNIVYNNNADGIYVSAEAPNLGESRDIRIYNNIVYGNGLLGVNGGTCLGVSGRVRNVEAYHNTCYKNIYGFLISLAEDYGTSDAPQNVVLRNNIFANTTYLNGRIAGSGITVRLERNLITNSVADLYEFGGGNPSVTLVSNVRAASAGFVNAGANDFHLTASSAARDKGSSTVGKATLDFDGVTRPQGASPDMGAFEYK